MSRWSILLVVLAACIPQRLVDRASDRDSDGFVARELGGPDCDDADASVHPDAPEICGDGVDNDCDGVIDDDGLGAGTWYPDADGDGYGVDAPRSACVQPAGHIASLANGIDCDDTDPDVNPGATEICFDAIDNDCDDAIDDDGVGAPTWYPDLDGDGFFADAPITACYAPEHYGPTLGEIDCDDGAFDVNPDADEICGDGVDNDCDDAIDDAGAFAPTWYPDLDGDTFTGLDTVVACAQPAKHLAAPSALADCNDLDGSIRPNAVEIWYDGVDQNCDDADDFDQDGDGYRSAAHTDDGDDCDDVDDLVHPGATEICDNFRDDDCDGTANHCRLTGTHDVADLADTTLTMTQSATYGAWGDRLRLALVDSDDVLDLVIGGGYYLWVFKGPLAEHGTQALAHARIASDPYALGWLDVAVGDFNGNGVADLAAGVNGYDWGEIEVYSGPVIGVYGPSDHSATIQTSGGQETQFARPGASMVAVPDMDGDGRDELLAGATGNGEAHVYLFSGPFPTTSTVDTRIAQFSVYKGSHGTGAFVQYDSVGATGKHLIAPSPSGIDGLPGDVGHIALIPTTAFSGNRSLADYTGITGIHGGTREGERVVTGDLNGDGVPDLIVSAPHYPNTGAPVQTRGRVYVLFGPHTAPRSLAAAAIRIEGVAATGRLGKHVVVGDFDGDGYDDLYLAGANGLVFYGPLDAGDLDEEDADLVLTGLGTTADRATAGDLDGDGRFDLVLGTSTAIYSVHGSGM